MCWRAALRSSGLGSARTWLAGSWLGSGGPSCPDASRLAYPASAPRVAARAERSALPLLRAHDEMTSRHCHSPPVSTSAARTAASAGLSGSALPMSSATGHCSVTASTVGPREASRPVAYAQANTSGTRSHGWWAAVAPANVETAIPAAAHRTATARVRLTPRKETNPAGSAPRAAKLPYSIRPMATPTASGVTTPSAARTAWPPARSRHRKAPKSSQPGRLSSLARNARPPRKSATRRRPPRWAACLACCGRRSAS